MRYFYAVFLLGFAVSSQSFAKENLNKIVRKAEHVGLGRLTQQERDILDHMSPDDLAASRKKENETAAEAVKRLTPIIKLYSKDCMGLLVLVQQNLGNNIYDVGVRNTSSDAENWKHALLKTDTLSFTSTGEAGQIFVQKKGERKVTLTNGFSATIPFFEESAFCKSMARILACGDGYWVDVIDKFTGVLRDQFTESSMIGKCPEKEKPPQAKP